jgi:hypothetical protein
MDYYKRFILKAECLDIDTDNFIKDTMRENNDSLYS